MPHSSPTLNDATRALTHPTCFGVSIDSEGRIDRVTATLGDVLGYREEEVVGRNWRDFVRPEDVSRIEGRRRGDSGRFADRCIVRDASGRDRRVDLETFDVRDPSGEVTHCVAFASAEAVEPQGWSALTERFESLGRGERAVLDALVRGLSNKGTANELEISVRAVENRRARVRQKLGLDSNAEVVRLATLISVRRGRDNAAPRPHLPTPLDATDGQAGNRSAM